MSAADTYAYSERTDDYQQGAYKASSSGSAFASTAFIIGFVVLVAGAFYISPFCTGSTNERKTLCAPIEIERDPTCLAA